MTAINKLILGIAAFCLISAVVVIFSLGLLFLGVFSAPTPLPIKKVLEKETYILVNEGEKTNNEYEHSEYETGICMEIDEKNRCKKLEDKNKLVILLDVPFNEQKSQEIEKPIYVESSKDEIEKQKEDVTKLSERWVKNNEEQEKINTEETLRKEKIEKQRKDTIRLRAAEWEKKYHGPLKPVENGPKIPVPIFIPRR